MLAHSYNNLTLEQAQAFVQQTIQDLTESLSQARQNLQELQLPGGHQPNFIKNNIDLIGMAKGQIQLIINEYFKDISDNYILLQSKYPNNEIKDLVLNQIDQTLIQLNEYSQKINSQTFGIEDYNNFKMLDFERVKDEVIREQENLQQQTQNMQKYSKISNENLPQVRINHRVVEGIYLTLNDYASTSWLGDLDENSHKQFQIDAPSYFSDSSQVQPLPIVDDEKLSYGYYSLINKQKFVQQLNFQNHDTLPYSPTVVVSPEGLIYTLGGINKQGSIVSSTHVINPTLHTIQPIAPMLVKRVGASACYIPPSSIPGSSSRGYIYVFGGRTDNMVKTKLCERFDIEKNQWEMVAKMEQAKARPACCYDSFDHTVYLFFGTDSNQQNICCVEKFNIISNTWSVIELSNLLPGFDISLGSAVVINQNQIMIFGGMRDSNYFKDQMYFNRKILLYNTSNDSFYVTDHQLPVDFLSVSNPIVQDKAVYALGTFMKTVDDKPSIFLDGAFLLQIKDIPKIIEFVQAF